MRSSSTELLQRTAVVATAGEDGGSPSSSGYSGPSPGLSLSTISHRLANNRSSHEDRLSDLPCRTVWARFSAWWTALVAVLALAFVSLAALVIEGGGSLHLRAATLRAAGGSAQIGAHGMCVLRVGEAVVVWAVLCSLRRRDRSCCCCCRIPSGSSSSSSSSHDSPGGAMRTASPGPPSSSNPSPSALCEAGLANEAWPSASIGSFSPGELPGSPKPGQHGELPRPGASLLCTLSGWVCVLLGCFAVTGSVSSLLVAMGGRTAPGMLGEMFSHHGMLARRSVLGWSLPTLTWIFFEIGSAGALYIACLSLLMLLRQSLSCAWSRLCGPGGGTGGAAAPSQCASRVQSCTRLCATGGAEPPLHHKLQSLAVHALALAISAAELCLNDLPVLWQHRTLALLFGCAFSLNVLGWHAYYGRFTYLYADAPRTSSVSALLACVLTPGALFVAFTAFASLSASTRVRG